MGAIGSTPSALPARSVSWSLGPVCQHQREKLRAPKRTEGTALGDVMTKELDDVASASAEELAPSILGFVMALK